MIIEKLRNFLFGSRTIAVGHCCTKYGNGVLLLMGRKRAGLTPEGARKIANQLVVWAEHAELHGSAIKYMKWVVNVTMEDAKAAGINKAAAEWIATSLEKTASQLPNGEQ